MKIGITGATGFIGKNLIDALKNQRPHVTIYEFNSKILNIVKEITLPEVDCLFHLAAYNSRIKSFDNEKHCFDVNVEGTRNIVKAAKGKVGRIIFSSSILVYKDLTQTSLQDELGYNDFGGPYGQSKIEAETIIKESGIPYTILRISSPYGKYEKKGAVLDIESHQVFLHPDSILNIVPVEDVVNAMMAFISAKENSIANVYGENVNLLELYDRFDYPVVRIEGKE